MNTEDEKVKQVFKELQVNDPYSEKNLSSMDDIDEPFVVKISEQSQENMDNYFSVDENEKKEENGMIKILGMGALFFIIVCIIAAVIIKDNKYVEIKEEGMKKEENWDDFVSNTKKDKNSSIEVKIYGSKGKVESDIELKYEDGFYKYGADKEKYKYLLDEKGKFDDLDVSVRIIALSNQQYTFEQLVNGLYKNTDTKYKNINLKDLEDAVNATNKLIEDIGAIEGTKDEDATAKLDEIDDIKYKLVCCF